MYTVPQKSRVYVTVTSVIDPTGYMQPREIIWEDGRRFPIEEIRDFRPANTVGMQLPGDCYTVVIHGQTRYLFFEHSEIGVFLGRWFVEAADDRKRA